MAQIIASDWIDEDCARVASEFGSNIFWSASGRLISHMMKLATGWRWDVIDDGVYKAWEKRSDRSVECAGILSSLEPGAVWPVRFKFVLDQSGSNLETGYVKVGSCSAIPCKFLTEERKMLMAEIQADQDYETDWMRAFRLENKKWHIELPEITERN